MSNPPRAFGAALAACRSVQWRLEPATEAHEACVAGVYAANGAMLQASGPQFTAERIARDLVRGEALPPGGKRDNLHTVLVRDGASGEAEAIGVLSVYAGHPKPDAVYVNTFFLKPARHRQGIGSAVMDAAERAGAEAGYREAHLCIRVPHWSSLWFWVRRGYTTITRADGDAQPGDPLGLMKRFG